MKKTSWSRQLRIYTGKSFRLFLFEHKWIVILSTVLIDLLLLFVLDREKMFVEYMDTRTGLFAIACACIWVGLFNSVQAVCQERDAIKHEHMESNLSLSAYISAHLVYEVFICAIESLSTEFIMIWYFREAVNNSIFSPLDLFLTLFLLIFAADTLGLLISSSVRNSTTAMTVMPFILIVQLVLSGFIFEVKGIAKAVSILTLSKWGMKALCVCSRINHYHTEEMQSYEYAVYTRNINEYNTGGARLALLWLVLFLFAAVFSFLSVAVLQLVDLDKR